MAAYWGSTNLHPLAAVMLVLVFVGIMIVDRRTVPICLLPALVFLPGGQRLVLGGVDFGVLRMLGLMAVLRFGVRAEFKSVRWGWIDLVALGSALLPALCAVARGDAGRLMMSLGMGFDFLSMFLVGRICLSDAKAWTNLIIAMAVISIPVALAFALEKMTARNVFAIFGGVPEVTRLRSGKLRAQGAFAHPIMAGAWFSACIPLFVGLYRARRDYVARLMGSIGVAASVIIIFAVDSATAIGGLIAALAGIAIFRYRSVIQYWRWLIPILLLVHIFSRSGLHGLLFTRISIVSGSTGHHRYRLYDAALNNFMEWLLIGSTGTSHWGNHLFDVTSEYVAAAVRGGLVGLVFLLLLQYKALTGLSRIRPEIGKSDSTLAFHIGLAISVQAFSYLAVSYFGQVIFLMGILPAGALSFAQATALTRTSVAARSGDESGSGIFRRTRRATRSDVDPVSVGRERAFDG